MHGETVIEKYGNETYHKDKYGNEVEKKCPVCGYNTGIVLAGNKKIINGQCIQCHTILSPIGVRKYE